MGLVLISIVILLGAIIYIGFSEDTPIIKIGIILSVLIINIIVDGAVILGHTNVEKMIENADVEYNQLLTQANLSKANLLDEESHITLIQDINEWNENVLSAKTSNAKWLTRGFYDQRYIDSLHYIDM